MLKKILLFADWYEPGFKAGGPIRSCVNFTRCMSEHYQVFVFTSDRDLGSTIPYHGLIADKWLPGKKNVSLYYCSPENLAWKNIRRQIDAIQPDYLYLNSMFSLKYSIYPLLITHYSGSGGNRPRVILAPRGMLKESAVRFKKGKKELFLRIFRALGLHRSAHFHATDETEVKDVRNYFGPMAQVTRVPNFPGIAAADPAPPPKETGQLSMIFVGRIHPIKNLDFLLHTLREVKARIQLTIAGSAENRVYWETCRKLIAELPSQIRVEYVGEIPNHALPAIIARHHIFVSPTQGENFGHAIFEALTLGKPALISDQTPWKDLRDAEAGWDIPLDRPGDFREAIEQAAAFGREDYERWSRSARRFAQEYIDRSNLLEEYQKLFS
jgi:glycosyltransferase involved in cell wall biosynthesis